MHDAQILIEVDGLTIVIAQPFTAREVLRLGGILASLSDRACPQNTSVLPPPRSATIRQ